MHALNAARRWATALDAGARRFQRAVIIISSIAVAAMICAVVLLRYVFRADLYGIEELVVFVGIWLFFFGASYASQQREQISAGVIPGYLPAWPARAALRLVTALVSLAVCAIGTWWAWEWLRWGLESPSRSPVYGIPETVTHVAVFASFALMSVYAARDTVHAVVALARGGEAAEPHDRRP